jgi:hypothetical protein
MVLRLPYPALDNPRTLQLVMQIGETDDSLSIFDQIWLSRIEK